MGNQSLFGVWPLPSILAIRLEEDCLGEKGGREDQAFAQLLTKTEISFLLPLDLLCL